MVKRRRRTGAVDKQHVQQQQQLEKHVRFAQGPLTSSPDGHPQGEGAGARHLRVLDRSHLRSKLTKHDVKMLEELLMEGGTSKVYEPSVNKLKKRVGLMPGSKPPRPYAKQKGKAATGKGTRQQQSKLQITTGNISRKALKGKQQGQQVRKRQGRGSTTSGPATVSNMDEARARSLPKRQQISRRGRACSSQTTQQQQQQAPPVPAPGRGTRGRSVEQSAQAPSEEVAPAAKRPRRVRGQHVNKQESGGGAAAPAVPQQQLGTAIITASQPASAALDTGDADVGGQEAGAQEEEEEAASTEVSGASLPGPPSPASVCGARKGNRSRAIKGSARARQAAAGAQQDLVESTPTACNAALPLAALPQAGRGGVGPLGVQGDGDANQQRAGDEEAAQRRGRQLADLVVISRQAWAATGAVAPGGAPADGLLAGGVQVAASCPAATPVAHAGFRAGTAVAMTTADVVGEVQGKKDTAAEECGESEQQGGGVRASRRQGHSAPRASQEDGGPARVGGGRPAQRMTRRRAAAAEDDNVEGAQNQGQEAPRAHRGQPMTQRASGAASTTRPVDEPEGMDGVQGATAVSHPPVKARGAAAPRKQQGLRVALINRPTPVPATPGGSAHQQQGSGWGEAGAPGPSGGAPHSAAPLGSSTSGDGALLGVVLPSR